ncbi:acetolactate synthase small subunit [Candidatus Pantoea edessiphila]|uniref:Acetolactate synthase small subunit n=1 Tax=Candidatus Pantoea edessiphila TaxID=2044610 RepID=A0A2P5T255_9GAMM|nr:acetolactate synthase small subunit [Candidatus Pantoea edessiphila]PPI88646.1 acetolactate synthase small subunit [Candidatus Pantoea edessiphila]
MRRVLSILIENEFGALSRVVGLFSQRGYNIESLTVAPTEDPSLSRMTIQTFGDIKVLEQIEKQLHKLIDVLHVISLEQENCIEREIMLVKIKVSNNERKEIKKIVEDFYGKFIDVTEVIYIVQLIGTANKLNEFLKITKNIAEIVEIVRSGIIGILYYNNI